MIARIANGQHGRVSREQLVAAGIGAKAIDHRIRCGRLHPEYRGVYAVGHRVETPDARFMAAVLAAGEGAALSHRSAIEHWGMRPYSEGRRIDLTTRNGGRRRRGIHIHRSPLPPDEVTELRGVPVTTVARTLIDFASVAGRRELERAMNEAQVRDLARRRELPKLLERHRRRPGTTKLQAILASGRIGTTHTRSELEEAFLSFIEATGLPLPLFNQKLFVGGREIEVDCVWPEQRVALELDSRTAHDTALAFESDRARDRALTVAGWRPLRVTWLQLESDKRRLEAELGALLQAAAA